MKRLVVQAFTPQVGFKPTRSVSLVMNPLILAILSVLAILLLFEVEPCGHSKASLS